MELEFGKEKLWSEKEERMENWERELFWGRKEGERRMRLEKELDERRRSSKRNRWSGRRAGLPPQVLQNLQHPGGLGDNGKPDSSSPSELI
ncbi:hypothetical protein V6N13_075305 [Hibiscus sabdariffa]